MTKEKVVSFNFYINDKSSPKTIIVDNELKKAHPLYLTVTFNRKNTQFRVILSENPIYLVDLAILDEDIMRERIDRYLKLIEDIVREEFKQQGTKFTLAGLGNRLKIYQDSLTDYVQSLRFGEMAKEATEEIEITNLIQSVYRILHYSGFISIFNFIYFDWRNEDYLKETSIENQKTDNIVTEILKKKLKDKLE